VSYRAADSGLRKAIIGYVPPGIVARVFGDRLPDRR
jgi:hypothetical protein